MQKKIDKPIFIVGCPRSGTTLLQQMLDAHPDVAIAPETHFMQYFWQKRQDYGDLGLDHNYQRLINDITALAEFKEMGLNFQQFSAAAWERSRTYQSLFQLILEQFAQVKQVAIVGEKTPNHVLYLSTLKQFFPSARFIHLIRDPRAVVNSWKSVPWSTDTIAGDARHWCGHIKAGLRYQRQDRDSLFTLYYEQLVHTPESTLQSVCKFLDLEFSPQMLLYHQQKSLINVEREPWKIGVTKPLTSKPVTFWQQELSKQEILEIEAIAWYEMKHLGYKVQTKIWRLLPAIIFSQFNHRYIQIKNKMSTANKRYVIQNYTGNENTIKKSNL